MKKIISITLAIIIVIGFQPLMLMKANAAEYPELPCNSSSDYVIYINDDTGGVELAVINSSENYSLLLERKEQLNPILNSESRKEYLVDGVPFEKTRLYFSTESSMDCDKYTFIENRMKEYNISLWSLSGNVWEYKDNINTNTICENTGDVIQSNLPIIEVFRKNKTCDLYKDFQDFNGKDYYFNGVGTGKQVWLSDNGIDCDRKILLPDDFPRSIQNVVYGNGLYILESASIMPHEFPEEKRTQGYTNYAIFTYNSNCEFVNKTTLTTYRTCTGFTDGYFYFYDKDYYISYNYKEKFYKSVDGIDYIEITKEEHNAAKEKINKLNNRTLGGYSPEINKKLIIGTPPDYEYKFLLNKTETADKYQILYEDEGAGFSSNRSESKDWVSIMFKDDLTSEGAKNKYLTLDGVYGIPLPYYQYESFWTTDSYVYIDFDKQTYFRVKISDLTGKPLVLLNDKILGFSQPPVMENDRTLVPMRFLFEQMGADVNWNEETQTATATVPINTDAQMRTFSSEKEKSVTFSIDDTIATVNGETATMDVPARLVNDKTMVPLRFLSENLGYNVEWDEATNTAIIITE